MLSQQVLSDRVQTCPRDVIIAPHYSSLHLTRPSYSTTHHHAPPPHSSAPPPPFLPFLRPKNPARSAPILLLPLVQI